MGSARSFRGAGKGRLSVATAAAFPASVRGQEIRGVLAGFQVPLPTVLILFRTFPFFLPLEELGWRRGAEQWGVFSGAFWAARGLRPRPAWRGPGTSPSLRAGVLHHPVPVLVWADGGGGFAGSGLCSDAGAIRSRRAPGCGLASQAPLRPPARETRQEGAHGPQSLASTGGQRRLRPCV